MAIIHEWQSTRALLVDFKKAFDLVNHNLLLKKLLNKNVPHVSSNGFSRSWMKGRNEYE